MFKSGRKVKGSLSLENSAASEHDWGQFCYTFPSFSGALVSRLMEITMGPLRYHRIYEKTHENKRQQEKGVFCSLSFCMVGKVHGSCYDHQARYILLNERGPRNKVNGPSCSLSQLLAEFCPMPTQQENAQATFPGQNPQGVISNRWYRQEQNRVLLL